MDFYVFGNYGARLKYDVDYYSWWGSTTQLPDNQLQIIPLTGDPDTATPIATVDLPARAQLFQVGNLAVAVTSTYVENSNPAQYASEIKVFDLSDPTSPVERGSLSTDQIQPSSGYYYGWVRDCWDCGRSWYYGSLRGPGRRQRAGLPGAPVGQRAAGHRARLLQLPRRATATAAGARTASRSAAATTPAPSRCSRLNGGPETCQGEIQRCTYGDDNQWSCVGVDADSVALQTYCYDQEKAPLLVVPAAALRSI